MKTTTIKMKLYAYLFLIRAILFNTALGFAIAAAVKHSEGMSGIAIAAIALTGAWLLAWDFVHFLWFSMNKAERTLYLAIRRHGSVIPEITKDEVKSKAGQKDTRGFFDDADGALEVKMAVNGAATLVNVFVGFHYIINARKFNKTPQEFTYTMK